ncbi:hypothetical protein GCM10010151_21250 [Actinoallomurus spadix]|uniref:NB-ARC domain-containing protein n=1 Tax=Actinoallomurus spadix TaxID=79912 RepID=A0ABP3FZR2_9ACTN
MIGIGIIVSALINMATGDFNPGQWRWWILGAIVLAGLVWTALEYRRGDDATPGQKKKSPPWMLPRIEEPIDRPALAGELSDLLTGEGPSVIGVTAVYGAGGFGKTTLTVQVCSRDEVRARYPGGLLWATIGVDRRGSDLATIANDLAAQLTGERPQFAGAEQAGRHLGRLLSDRPPTLLVLDDVWSADQLQPFLFGARTTLLVTTRTPAVLPDTAKAVHVDEMEGDESRALICRELPSLPAKMVAELLNLTGHWPLLMAMVNAVIHRHIRDGVTAEEAARLVADQLTVEGPAYLDLRFQSRRDHAVGLTVSLSLQPLSEVDRDRYYRLGIFAEDTDIPLSMLSLLWGLTLTETRRLCEELADLSLVKAYRRGSSSLQLHDVIRDHLRHQLGTRMTAVNAAFLDAARTLLPGNDDRWWLLPPTEIYLWRQLTYHLAEAGRHEALKELVSDLRWGEERIRIFGLASYESDLVRVDDMTIGILRRALARKSHLLGPIDPPHSHADLLVSRLYEIPELRELVDAFEATLSSNVARLTNRWPIPPVDPALVRVFPVHEGTVTGCAVSPDGTLLATAGTDATVCIWNTTTWTAHAVLDDRHDPMAICAFSPDGAWLVTVGADHAIRVWDTTLWVEHATMRGHTDVVTGCDFSPDGGSLATVGADSSIRVWDTSTWKERTVIRGHADMIRDCAFSPDGRWLATTGTDQTVRVWDIAAEEEHAILLGHTDVVTGCDFSPTGEWLATVGADRAVKIWDTASWTVHATLTGHTEIIGRCAFSPDGRRLASVSFDRTVRIWNASGWSEEALMRGHTDAVMVCAFAPSGEWLATGSADHNVRIWDMSTEHRRGAAHKQNRSVTSCAIAPDSTWLIAVGNDHLVAVWGADAPPAEYATLLGHTEAILDCVIAPDGSWFATCGADREIRVWATATWTEERRLRGHTGDVTGCAVSPDGRLLATTGADRTIRVWNTVGWTEHVVLSGHTDTVTACAFSPDGAWLATTGADHTIRVWNTATWTEHVILDGHTDTVTACAFSPDGAWLATTGADHTIRVWNTATWTERIALDGHTDTVTACAFSPDGAWLATTGADITLRIWEARTWCAAAAMRTNGRPNDVCWFASGRTLCLGVVGGIYQFTFTPPVRS